MQAKYFLCVLIAAKYIGRRAYLTYRWSWRLSV